MALNVRHLYPKENRFEDYPFNKCTSVLQAIQAGELYGSIAKSRIGKKFRRIQDEIATKLLGSRIHYILEEKPFPSHAISNIDKIFASYWMDEDTILTGGKDNKLISWDVSTPRITHKIIRLPSGTSQMPVENCGIHSVTSNPNKNLLATGGHNPSELAIFSIPDMIPRAVLMGHTDWTFDSCWLSDYDVISVSRDKGICLWNISNISKETTTDSIPNLSPNFSLTAHNRKVRKVKTNNTRCKIATVSADATMKIWDAISLRNISITPLPDAHELVCLEWNFETNCILIGSQTGIQILDPNSNSIVLNLDSMGEDWGIRSLSSKQNLVTIGTGVGKLYFYDIRKMNFEKKLCQECTPLFCQASRAFLRQDLFYERYFAGIDVPHAIYTTEYDPTGTKLFTAGGPLLYGLSGSYAAIW